MLWNLVRIECDQVINTAILTLAILSQPAPVPMVYGIVDCNGWPLAVGQVTDDGIRVVANHIRAGRATTRLLHVASGVRANMVAHKLGSTGDGYTAWTVRVPARVAALVAASPACRLAITYAQIGTLTVAQRNWIAARSTCYGAATWRGRAYKVWPCIWSTERASEGSVTTLSGIGPGIMSGGSGAEAAGIEDTP